MTMLDPKTPEAAAYVAARRATERGRAQIWRRVAAVLAVTVAGITGLQVYNSTTISHINGSQAKVESVARCEERAFDAIVSLAFKVHDKNPKDYAKATRGC